jgi:chemotaxis protein MotB
VSRKRIDTVAREKREKKLKRGTPAWMVTYGDMVTLLLVFFVFLLTAAKIEGYELQLILSAFRGSFGMYQGGLTLAKGVLAELGQQLENLPSKEKGSKLAKSLERAVSTFEPEIKRRFVKIEEDERGIVISLVADAFFESGSAELTPEGEEIIGKMGRFLSDREFRENEIRVEGHTDNIQPGGDVKKKFDSNWELSAARSITVVKRLVDEGVRGGQLQAVGYGEFQPIESNDIEEGRAYNRRIEIIIMRKKEYSLY